MTNIERIKALRNCANVNYECQAEDASCSKCPYNEMIYCKRTMIRDAADALEVAEKRIAELEAQLPKEGYWIPNSPFTGNCSECGGNGNLKDNYCSNCGARMKGEWE